MTALHVVHKLRSPHDVRAYRRRVAATIGQLLPLRMLPALRDVPIPLRDAEGLATNLPHALNQHPHVTLHGPFGSGRRVLLWQLALRWCANDLSPLPGLLSLPQVDAENLPPTIIIARWLSRFQNQSVQWISHAIRGTTPQVHVWGLLVTGWEELAPERRAAWQAALIDTIQRQPQVHIVVALPATEPGWKQFQRVEMARPDAETRQHWVQHLVPQEHQARVRDALAPDGPLHALDDRLFELALLAWMVRHGELPAHRSALYRDVLSELLASEPARHVTMAHLRLLAAYGEAPPRFVAGLVEPSASGRLTFAHPLMQHYLAASQLVLDQQLAPIAELEPDQQREIARFAATLLDEPTPLLRALWGQQQPDDATLLTLGACLRERSDYAPAWVLRIISSLALVAHRGSRIERQTATNMLPDLMPVLDTALQQAAQADSKTWRFIMRLLDLLPPELATQRAERLAYADQVPDELAWQLADELVRASGAQAEQPADQAGLARWAYVFALSSTTTRQQVAPMLDVALVALTSADPRRLIQACSALLRDAALPTAARLQALEPLRMVQDEDITALLAHLTSDADQTVREAVLVALDARAPEQTAALLAAIAAESGAGWHLRQTALERFSAREPATGLLKRSACDATLPLAVRLRAVVLLRERCAVQMLLEITTDPSIAPVTRGLAAQSLGQCNAHDTIPSLSALARMDDTASSVVVSICRAMQQLGGHEAESVLLDVLQRSSADIAVTLAAIAGLGHLRSGAALSALLPLLGEGATLRLTQALPPQPLDLPVEQAQLPAALALRLAAMTHEGDTPADKPTTLGEFIAREGDVIRAAVATALGRINTAEARDALVTTLSHQRTTLNAPALIAALADANTPDTPALLETLAQRQDIEPMIRWMVVQHLPTRTYGPRVLLALLNNQQSDPFIRGAAAESLGQQRVAQAASPLIELVRDSHTEEHLRTQALAALGTIDTPEAELPLLQIIGDEQAPTELRGLAAQHLPQSLSLDARKQLRDLIRREQQPAALVQGIVQALGRTGDTDAKALFLRYAQEDEPAIAAAALGAIEQLGDASMAPALVSITQNSNVAPTTRLRTVGTLLALDADTYRPLLNGALDHGPLSLRMQALDHVLATANSTESALRILLDREFPLSMRLRVMAHLSPGAVAPALLALIEDTDAETQLRLRAIDAVGNLEDADSRDTLIRLARSARAALALRLRAIAHLHHHPTSAVRVALSSLAEDDDALIRARAAEALLGLETQRAVQQGREEHTCLPEL